MKLQISLILLTFMILQTDAVSSQKDKNLIETTCKRTQNYNLCISILRADPGAAAADVPGLGIIVVGVVKKNIQEIIADIDNYIKSLPDDLLLAVRRCKEVYTVVLDGDIPVAVQATRGNPKSSETAMADAGVEANMCEQALERVGPSPFSTQNKFVGNAAAVAGDIIRTLL